MTIHSTQNNSINTEAYRSAITLSRSEYVVLSSKNKPVSKSLQSKLNNLLYTLSTPFRALIRLELHRRVGQREENSAAFKNIKSTPMPRATAQKRKAEIASQPDRGYTVVSGKGGYGKPSLFGRLWR
jgi:lantibiotic modifying enzyme